MAAFDGFTLTGDLVLIVAFFVLIAILVKR